jgi:senataxin
VITFYKKQVRKLRSLFMQQFGRSVLESVDINTVDGFQGQEKEVIILSCVRASRGILF